MEHTIDELTQQLEALKGVHGQNEELKVLIPGHSCFNSQLGWCSDMLLVSCQIHQAVVQACSGRKGDCPCFDCAVRCQNALHTYALQLVSLLHIVLPSLHLQGVKLDEDSVLYHFA